MSATRPMNSSLVHVRNLLIIGKAPGQGVVSASLVTDDRDELTAFTGVPIKLDGSNGAPFTATLPQTVSFGNGAQIVLTDRPLITVTSPDLVSGGSASATLQFKNAGEVTLLIPVVDGSEPQYATISPSPVPTPSAYSRGLPENLTLIAVRAETAGSATSVRFQGRVSRGSPRC